MYKKNQHRKKIYIQFTVLFIIMSFIVFSPFLLRGNSLIGESDSFNQTYPVFVYFGDYIREIIKGNVIQFDFRIGLGDDVISTLNWHGFGDVLQVFSAFVPVQYAETVYNLTMLFKFYLCGIAFLVYIKRYVHNLYYQLTGAVMYTFSIFALIWGLNCWMFLNPMITFPIILYGIDELIQNRRKISYLMIGALFIQAMNGFYFLYMEILLSIIYFGVVDLVRLNEKKQFLVKNMFFDGLSVMLHGLCGCCLGGVLLIPSIIGFFQSSRTGGTKVFENWWDWLLFDKPYYEESFKNLLIPSAYETCITISIIVLLGSIIYFQNKKVNKEFKFLAGGLGFLFWVPAMGSLMNGFSYSVDRWYFAVLLFFIVITLLALEQGKDIPKRQLVLFFLVGTATVLYNFALNEKNEGIFLRTGVFLIFIYMLPFVWKKNSHREKWILLYAIMTITVNGLLLFGPKILGGSGYSAGFKENNETWKEISDSTRGIEGKGVQFERYDIYDSSLAASLVMDYYGTTEYFSMLNSKVSEFYRELFISPGVRSATWILKGLDGRSELQSLLSVSYYMDFSRKEGETISSILPNEEYHSLGIVYDNWIEREEFDLLNPMEKESTLINSIVLEERPRIDISKGKPKKGNDKEIDVTIEYMNVIEKNNHLNVNENSFIRIRLLDFDDYRSVTERKKELYVKLSDFILYDEGVEDVFVGNKSLQLRNRKDDYYIGPDEFWVNISELQRDDEGFYFDIEFEDEKVFSLGKVQLFLHMIDKQAVNEREVDALKNLLIEHNSITGTIDVGKDVMLFLSVPYSVGWKAWVDEELVNVYCADISFIALEVEEGEHSVQLVYETPGLQIGIFITGFSFLVLMIITVFHIFVKKRKQECE